MMTPSEESYRQNLQQALKQTARKSVNAFCQVVLRDGKGNRVTQAPIHRLIQDHIDWCKENNRYAGIVAPWGHGKTEQIIARTLCELGNNQEARIKIVCNSDQNARQRVSAIRRYIESNPDYNSIYPNLRPKKRFGQKNMNEKWSDHELLVNRNSPSKDNSIEAWGVLASAMGARCDLLIVDDPCDLKNSVLEPATRLKVLEVIKSGWMSRLEPEAFMIYIATIWHEEDATSFLKKNEKFCFLWLAVNEGFTGIDGKLFNGGPGHPLEGFMSPGGQYKIPLWSAKWSKPALLDRFKSLGTRSFNRGFRQIPFSDDDLTFPHFKKCVRHGTPTAPASFQYYMGVDLSGKNRPGVALFTLGRSPRGTFSPVECRHGKWDFNRLVAEIHSSYEKYNHQVIYVENNALQEMVVDAISTAGRGQLPIRGYHTGKQKNDPSIGLPALDVEFENGIWLINDPGHEIDCTCGYCRWMKSMNQYPNSSETDTVMACWFAHQAAMAGNVRMAARVLKNRRNWRKELE